MLLKIICKLNVVNITWVYECSQALLDWIILLPSLALPVTALAVGVSLRFPG